MAIDTRLLCDCIIAAACSVYTSMGVVRMYLLLSHLGVRVASGRTVTGILVPAKMVLYRTKNVAEFGSSRTVFPEKIGPS